jgi:predicted component of type VI protein secretion system
MDDTSISRSHCQLRRKNNMAWEIKCLSSGNLYVNDILIQEGETQTLYDKDTLIMGRSTFSVRLGPISPEEHKGEQKKAREPHAASRKGRSYGAD